MMNTHQLGKINNTSRREKRLGGTAKSQFWNKSKYSFA